MTTRCTLIFNGVVSIEHEVGARNLAYRDGIGREKVNKGRSKAAPSTSWKQGEGIERCPCKVRRRRASGDGRGKRGGGGKGNGGRRGKHGSRGRSTKEDGGGSATAAGGDGDGSSAKAAEVSTPAKGCLRCGKKGHKVVNSTENLSSWCNGRGHTADVCPHFEGQGCAGGNERGWSGGRRRR